MLIRKLKESRYDPNNLKALEAKRWEHVCNYNALMTGPWKDMFKHIPESGYFCGHHKNKLVCFTHNGIGISEDYPIENDRSDRNIELFVRCLRDEDLPLYINSKFEKVKSGVAKRLRKDKDFEQIPTNEDLVALYFKINKKSYRLLMTIEYYSNIILDRFKKISEKVPKKSFYDPPMMTLAINKRIYIAKGGHFILKPEDENYITTASECCKEDFDFLPKPLMNLHVLKYNLIKGSY